MQKFGDKLRTLRIFNNLTLKDLANYLGLNAHGYLSEIECGKKKPTVDFILRVSDFFLVSTDELLKDDIELKPKTIDINGNK